MPSDVRQVSVIDRREAIRRVSALLGGIALVSESALITGCRERAPGTAQPAQFQESDVAFLDEVAETILPETSTPGAKAAKVGAFMALMVTEAYDERTRHVFQQGLRQLEDACRRAHAVPFMQTSAGQRLSLVEALDREQHAVMEDRAPKRRVRAPAAESGSDEPAHYFRLMKELTLLGYFTSQIGATQVLQYEPVPGRFQACIPIAEAGNGKQWATETSLRF